MLLLYPLKSASNLTENKETSGKGFVQFNLSFDVFSFISSKKSYICYTAIFAKMISLFNIVFLNFPFYDSLTIKKFWFFRNFTADYQYSFIGPDFIFS